MNWMVPAAALACAACVGVLLLGHAREARPAIAAGKLGASACFVAVAVASGATRSPYGALVLVALLLSFAGDAALLARGTGRAFLAGMALFAAAHITYTAAFALLGVDTRWLLAGAVAAGTAVATLSRSLSLPRGRLLVALAGYAVIVSAMASMATGAFGDGATPLVPLGAWGFVVSDVFVARHRFGTASLANKLVGLPLYYAAQVALALSVAVA